MIRPRHHAPAPTWLNALIWTTVIGEGIGTALGIGLTLIIRSAYGNTQILALVAVAFLIVLMAALALVVPAVILFRVIPASMKAWRLCCGALYAAFVLASSYDLFADVSEERFVPKLEHVVPGFSSLAQTALFVCVIGLGTWFVVALPRDIRNGHDSHTDNA